jgi:hypothetical protein
MGLALPLEVPGVAGRRPMMRVRISITILAGAALFVLASALEASAQDASRDEAAIQDVLETAYVQGLHVLRDEAVIRNGFHPDFIMSVNDGDGVILVPLDMWLERLELDGQPNPGLVEWQVDFIDVTGDAASAKLQIYEDGEHLYTDYFGLYKMPDGWKIVNKSFHSHP